LVHIVLGVGAVGVINEEELKLARFPEDIGAGVVHAWIFGVEIDIVEGAVAADAEDEIGQRC